MISYCRHLIKEKQYINIRKSFCTQIWPQMKRKYFLNKQQKEVCNKINSFKEQKKDIIRIYKWEGELKIRPSNVEEDRDTNKWWAYRFWERIYMLLQLLLLLFSKSPLKVGRFISFYRLGLGYRQLGMSKWTWPIWSIQSNLLLG